MWAYFIPLFVLAALVLLLGVLALLSRIKGGRYVKPVVTQAARVPLLRKGLEKASRAALERENPALASAIRKMERFGAVRDPQRAQQALSRLTPAERQAYMEAAEEQGVMQTPQSRAARRRMERMQRGARRKR
jgi:hypothetical protein